MKIKTVLAPGAPWYPKEKKKQNPHKYRTKPGKSDPAQTTDNFYKWLKKQQAKDRKLMRERQQCGLM